MASLKILDFLKHRQSYSLVKTPLYSHKNLTVVWPAEANATLKNKQMKGLHTLFTAFLPQVP